MEGGRGVGGGSDHFGHQNLPNNHRSIIYRPTPPLTAIDRFLYGHSHFSTQQKYIQNNNDINKETLASTNRLCGVFPPSGGAIGGGVSWSSFQEASFVDGLLVDGDHCLNWTYEGNPNEDLNADHQVKASGKSCKGIGKKSKKGSCATLIKGQWTEEEDR